MGILFKYFLAWFPMLLLAILNGTLRDLVYKQYTGELAAHQLSTISLIFLFAFYVYYIVGKVPPASGVQAVFLGIFWMTLTLLFEFGFGLYRGRTWEQLLADYNIFQGRLWVLIPLWVTIAPYVFYRLKVR